MMEGRGVLVDLVVVVVVHPASTTTGRIAARSNQTQRRANPAPRASAAFMNTAVRTRRQPFTKPRRSVAGAVIRSRSVHGPLGSAALSDAASSISDATSMPADVQAF